MPKRRNRAKKRLRFPKRLQSLTTSSLALYFAVSPSTIRAWKRDGIPLARKEALGAFVPFPIARETKRALKLAPEALASVAGVSLSTAKRWKRNGVIPERSKGFLNANMIVEAVPIVRMKPERSTSNYSGRFTMGYVVLWQYPEDGQELDETSIRSILDLLATGRRYRAPGLSYQATFEVNSILASHQKIRQSYQTVEMNDGETTLMLPSTANASISDLIAESSKLLHEASKYITKVNNFRLIVRRKKEGSL